MHSEPLSHAVWQWKIVLRGPVNASVGRRHGTPVLDRDGWLGSDCRVNGFHGDHRHRQSAPDSRRAGGDRPTMSL
jgi:hypothetical protein